MMLFITPLLCGVPLLLIALFIVAVRGPDFPGRGRLRFALYTGLGAACVGLAYPHSTGPRGFISFEPASQAYGWPWPWFGYMGLGNLHAPLTFSGGVLLFALLALLLAWLADQLRPRLPAYDETFASGSVVVLVLLVPLGAVLLRDVRLPPLAIFQPPPRTPTPVEACEVDLVPAVDEPGRHDVRIRTTAHILEARTYTFIARLRLKQITITQAFPVGDQPLAFVFPSNQLDFPPPNPEFVLIFEDNEETLAAQCMTPGYTLDELGIPTPTNWPPLAITHTP